MKPCCDRVASLYDEFGEDARRMMGSHYHCARCDAESSMVGHATTICKNYSKGLRDSTPHHFCCPGDCEFDSPGEMEREIAFWESRGKKKNINVIKNIQVKLDFSRKVRKVST